MSLLKILALDKEVITYRKELNPITGSITATILLQQFIYWDEKNNHQPFYKFIEPCNNEKYKDGDSWTEELGFSKKEFTGAYKKLEDLGIVSKKINMSRVTFYTLNIEVLSKLLKGIYISDKREFMEVPKGNIDNSKSFDTETTTETTTEILKNTKKDFQHFIKILKSQAPIKSKVTETKNGFDFYSQIQDKQQLLQDYINHQRTKGEYAQRITAFMEDYNTRPQTTTTAQQAMNTAGNWAMNKLNGTVTTTGGAIC